MAPPLSLSPLSCERLTPVQGCFFGFSAEAADTNAELPSQLCLFETSDAPLPSSKLLTRYAPTGSKDESVVFPCNDDPLLQTVKHGNLDGDLCQAIRGSNLLDSITGNNRDARLRELNKYRQAFLRAHTKLKSSTLSGPSQLTMRVEESNPHTLPCSETQHIKVRECEVMCTLTLTLQLLSAVQVQVYCESFSQRKSSPSKPNCFPILEERIFVS
jgi:hypothetical protein